MFKNALRRTFHCRDRSTERSKLDSARPNPKPGSVHADRSAHTTMQDSEVAANENSDVSQRASLSIATAVGNVENDLSVANPEPIDGPSETTATHAASGGKGPSTPEKAMLALKVASDEFTKNYERYQAKHKQFVSLGDNISRATLNADTVGDPFLSAMAFKQHISSVVAFTERKAELSSAKWPNRVGAFLVSLYPVMRIAVGLGATAAEVGELKHKANRSGRRRPDEMCWHWDFFNIASNVP